METPPPVILQLFLETNVYGNNTPVILLVFLGTIVSPLPQRQVITTGNSTGVPSLSASYTVSRNEIVEKVRASPQVLRSCQSKKRIRKKEQEKMKSLKSAVVLLALMATLLGGYLIGGPALDGRSAQVVLHQPALYQHLASGGSSSGGDPGNN
jgi:hypothetical protein